MRRVIVNRWWTLVLAMFVSVAWNIAMPSAARSDGAVTIIGDGSDNSVAPTPGSGDPDIPINNGKGVARPANSGRRAWIYAGGRSGAGDATTVTAIWVFRYRLALQVFRALVLR